MSEKLPKRFTADSFKGTGEGHDGTTPPGSDAEGDHLSSDHNVHDAWDADAFEAHRKGLPAPDKASGVQFTDAYAGDPRYGVPAVPESAKDKRASLQDVIAKLQEQSSKPSESIPAPLRGANRGANAAPGAAPKGPDKAPPDPNSYAETKKRMDALALETRGPNGLANRFGEADPDSAAAKKDYARATAEWKKSHPNGEAFPFADRASWHRDRIEKDRQERAVKGVKETTDAEYLKSAPQLEAMLGSEKAYLDAYKRYLGERSQTQSLLARLKGGMTGNWDSKSEELPPDVEQLKQDWYAKRGAYIKAGKQSRQDRIDDKKKAIGASLGRRKGETDPRKRTARENADTAAARRLARIEGLNGADGKPRLSLEERHQRRFGRTDAIFGAKEAELAVREQSLMERHGWVGKMTERWNKLPAPARAVITSVAFLGAGAAVGAASTAGALTALTLGSAFVAARIAAEKIPPNATGRLGVLRNVLIGVPAIFGSVGRIAGKATELGAKAIYASKGTKRAGRNAGAAGEIGSAAFGGSLEDVDRARGKAAHVDRSVQNWSVLGRILGGSAGGMALGHYGLSPSQGVQSFLHHAGAFPGSGPEIQHVPNIPQHGAHALHQDTHQVPPAHLDVPRAHADAAPGVPGSPELRGSIYDDHSGPLHGGSSVDAHLGSHDGMVHAPGASSLDMKIDPQHDITDANQVPPLPVSVHAHHGLGYENMVKQLHNQLAKQYPTPDALAHAPPEIRALLTGNINSIAHRMAMDPKIGFYDPVHHTNVDVPPGATLSITPGGHIIYDDGHGNLAHHGVTYDRGYGPGGHHAADAQHHERGTHHEHRESRAEIDAREDAETARLNLDQKMPNGHGGFQTLAERMQQRAAYEAWQRAHPGTSPLPPARPGIIERIFSLPKAPLPHEQPASAAAPHLPPQPTQPSHAAPRQEFPAYYPTSAPTPPAVTYEAPAASPVHVQPPHEAPPAAPPAHAQPSHDALPAPDANLNRYGTPVNAQEMHVYQRSDGSYAAFGGDDADKLRAWAGAEAVKLGKAVTVDRTFSPEPGVTYPSVETFVPPFGGIGPVESHVQSNDPSLVPRPDEFTKMIV